MFGGKGGFGGEWMWDWNGIVFGGSCYLFFLEYGMRLWFNYLVWGRWRFDKGF